MEGAAVNLVDLLAPKMPKPQPALAEVAEVAESQQPQPIPNPPPLAENETRSTTAFPPNPPLPPPITREYFASQGVNLLPEDIAFLRWHLPKGTVARNKATRQYLDNWRKGMRAETVAHRKENAGRWAANIGLQSKQG